MEELSETITCVKSHFHIRTFIGFGVGLGANVLARYATKYPADVSVVSFTDDRNVQFGWGFPFPSLSILGCLLRKNDADKECLLL